MKPYDIWPKLDDGDGRPQCKRVQIKTAWASAVFVFCASTVWADGGCHSPYTSGCMIWYGTLVFGMSLLFWAIFLPFFYALSLLLVLNKQLTKVFLTLSFISVVSTLCLLTSDKFKYSLYSLGLEQYENYSIWILVPVSYLLIHVILYCIQTFTKRCQS